MFWGERDIKFEQKYLFTLAFNKGGLRKINKTYHTFSHTQMKEKGDGKGKVKSRNKDKESRGEGRLFNF